MIRGRWRALASVALVAVVGVANPASAATVPLWPCEVPVWIEDGARLPTVVAGALKQLDDATVISWPIVDDRADAMVTIGWADLDDGLGGLASVAANDLEKVAGTVEVDPSTSNRWAMWMFLHELGHIAGLDHNDVSRSVMSATDVPWRKYQPYDLEQLALVECTP